MRKNFFFEKKGPFLLREIFDKLNVKKIIKIFNIKPLDEAIKSDMRSFNNLTLEVFFPTNPKATECL